MAVGVRNARSAVNELWDNLFTLICMLGAMRLLVKALQASSLKDITRRKHNIRREEPGNDFSRLE
jgi:hypothetical protein